MTKMITTFLFLFIFLFLASCGKGGGGGSHKGDSVAMEDITPNAPVTNAALNFDVNVRMDNFNSQQEDKVLTAATIIKKVVGSEEFRNAILSYKYVGSNQFADNDGLSNAQIYKKIIEGSEKLQPGADNEMDLTLEVFNRSDSTVGYTFPGELRVWMNSKFFNKFTPAKVTQNMMHEWLHKLGFKHDQKNTPKRPHSVPYAVGNITSRLATNYN